MDYTRKFTEKLSVEQAKIELLNIAYGNGDTFLRDWIPPVRYSYGIVILALLHGLFIRNIF